METSRTAFNNYKAQDLLSFDFSVINEMDPSVSQGVNKVLFDDELLMKIHFIEPDNSIHT